MSKWLHQNAFQPGTLVRADSMNLKLDGIASSFAEIYNWYDTNLLKMPTGFSGSNQLPNKTYANSLIMFNAQGALDFYDLTAFDTKIQNAITTTANSASAAATSESNAQGSANFAATSKSDAATSASEALSSKNASADTLALLQKYVSYPEDQIIPGTSDYSLVHWKKKAESYSGSGITDAMAQAKDAELLALAAI